MLRLLTAIACLALTAPMALAQGAAAGNPVLATQSGQAPNLSFPSVFGAATAFPPPAGTAFAGLTWVTPRGGISGAGADGDLAFGVVLGNPIEDVSVTLGVDINSLEDDFADAGGLSVTLVRALDLRERSATFGAITGSNLAAWGDARLGPEKVSVYVSHLTSFGGGVPAMLTLGYGNDTTYRSDGSGLLEDGAFAGIGIGLAPGLSVSASANATQVNLGLTAALPGIEGAGVTLGVYDVADNTDRQQISLSLSYGFNLFR